MAARKTASQIVYEIFQRESPEVCEQLIGIAKIALKSRKPAAKPAARPARKAPDALVNDPS